MAHLKLGAYSFVINANELGITAGVQKVLSRDELPDKLKPLFDILKSGKCFQKIIFLNIIGYTDISGIATQISTNSIELLCSDGRLFLCEYRVDGDSNETIVFEYIEY